MRITVLGKSPAWQDAGGACSGYLLEEGDTTLLLECGNGVFAKLREHVDYTDVDAVLVTHLHADHFVDLVPYSYALLLTPRQQPVPVAGHPGTDDPARPRLIAPPGSLRFFRNVVGCWGDEELIEQAFRIEEFDGESTVEVGPLTATFTEVPHFILTHAVNMTSDSRWWPVHLRRRLPAVRGAGRRGSRHRSAARRGDAAASGADRDPGPPDPGRGGGARPSRRRQARRPHPHLRRARRRVGPRAGLGGIRCTRGRRPGGRRLRGLTPARACVSGHRR